MKNLSFTFYLRLAFIALFSALVMWGVGDVMRESDQASVITGSIQLARDGYIVGRDFYNYDRTYGSYWVLASVYKMMGLEEVGASFSSLVTVGNYVAAVVLLIGLVVAFLTCGPSRWWEWVSWLVCLVSPVFLFSAPLLSSNVISAGFLFLLVVVLRKRGGIWGDVLAGSLAFCAVAARADAVLLMPLIAFLSIQKINMMSALRDRRLWFVAGASVLALFLGSTICTRSMYEPATFFTPLLFGAFLALGMNGALVLLVFLMGALIICGIMQKKGAMVIVCLSLIVPLSFYWNLMYTPRHLMTTLLGVVFFTMLPRGREYMADFCETWCGRVAMRLIAAASVAFTFIGVNMSSFTSGRVCMSSSTLFPTADGHWPMGANAWFYKRLHDTEERPLDHNQRVWRAWRAIPPEGVPEDRVSILSKGLVSYGSLWLKVMGKEKDKEGNMTLFDGRSVLKSGLRMDGGVKEAGLEEIDKRPDVIQIGEAKGEAIYAFGADDKSLPKKKQSRWQVLQILRQYCSGDDFIVTPTNGDLSSLLSKGVYRWVLIVPEVERESFNTWRNKLEGVKFELLGNTEFDEVIELHYFELSDFSRMPQGGWIARSSLAGFMQRKKYKF